MKIIFTGGGTAGHINPAVSMIEEIRKQKKDADILFIGRRGGRENRILRTHHIAYEEIEVCGISRKFNLQNIKNVILALRARREAKEIIRKFSPDAVVGTGGYVSWPVISAARSLKIPTAIHESNMYPGLTTKLLARESDIVMLNNEKTKEFLPRAKQLTVVGNPLRESFLTITREGARRELGLSKNDVFIVSFGGSIGAEKLNEAVISLMRDFSEKKRNVRHIHGVGERYYKGIDKESLPRKSSGCRIVPFIENMPLYLRAADIVISRCGAMTLSEVALVGTAAILIPSPNVTDNHQYKNAKILADAGAAILIEESALTKDTLLGTVTRLYSDKTERERLGNEISRFARPSARAECYRVIRSLTDKK